MIAEASETQLKTAVSSHIANSEKDKLLKLKKVGETRIGNFEVGDESFQTLKVQFKALGLITKSVRNRSVKDKLTYWTLTPFGDTVMSRLRAVRKSSFKDN